MVDNTLLTAVDLSFLTNSTFAVIGTEFLKSWYSVFDYGNLMVGFAPVAE